MSALRVLPLGFNSCLEAVKICACTEPTGLSHIIVYAAKLYTIATERKKNKKTMSNQLQQDIKQALAYRSSSTHKTLMEIPYV
jgi:hypothetical protein